MITICLTYFKSLALANLAAALHSVRRQDLSCVDSIVVVDNDTADSATAIRAEVDAQRFPIPTRVLSFKHGDPSRTHSWSTNAAVREATAPWVLFTRADYILDFHLVKRFVQGIGKKEYDLQGPWNGFVTANVYHLNVDVGECERTAWRREGTDALRALPGVENDYTIIDAGVWMARKSAFDRIGGMDEGLTAWGHAQTYFQHLLHVSGVEFVRIPEPLFYHPLHSAPRDIELAHRQLAERGIDLRELWTRHRGVSVYR